MANSRLIKSDDLVTGGFDDVATDCILGGSFSTASIPDSAEFTPTPNKKEVVVRGNCSRVMVGILEWQSSTKTYDIDNAALDNISPVSISARGIAIGGPRSGLGMFYNPEQTSSVQITDDAKSIIFGGPGYAYMQATGINSTLRMGSVASGGRVELTTGSGVVMRLEGNGRTKISLPTFASNSAAVTAGLEVETLYKTATGEIRVVV